MLSHADGSGVNIIALTACCLSARSTAGTARFGAPKTLQQEKECAESDAVAVVVAWVDMALQQHVTVLVLHLKRVLSLSWTGYTDGSMVRVTAQDALSLCPSQSVLRLFYHPAMTAPAMPSPSDTATSSRHVVMCSLSSAWAASSSSRQHGSADSGAGTSGPSSGAVTNALKKASATATSGGAAERTTSNASPSTAAAASTAANPRRRGQLRFLTVSVEDARAATAPSDEGEISVTAQPSALSDVAVWLERFQIDRVVCAFAVQSRGTPRRCGRYSP